MEIKTITNTNVSSNKTEEELAEIREKRKKEHDKRMFKYALINQIRKKYSIDDELAVLRQKDTKPEEFEEYNKYVEDKKAELKIKYNIE